MEGIAKITGLKMRNEKFKGYVTVIPDGDEYEAKFTSEDKFPVYSRIKNLEDFIRKALDNGWSISVMEVG